MSTKGGMTIGELLRQVRETPIARSDSGVTREEVLSLAEPVAKYVRAQIREALTPLNARNAACEQRIVELEQRNVEFQAHLTQLQQRPTLHYMGVWSAQTLYAPGDFATHDGSTWACERACTGMRPGTAEAEGFWILAVKRGRDAKDRR
jgi:hypothetical protein